jgi:hypothetical protein
VEKWIFPSLKFEATFKNEDKEGTRLWGRGYDCAAYVCGPSTTTALNQANFLKNAILMIPEPIDSTIKQFEAKLAFHDEKLNLTAGYYGSFYTNSNGNISYSRKEDKTPNALYNAEGTAVTPATTPASYINDLWNNNHVSNTHITGKLEASYRLPYNLRGTVGADYKEVERMVPESAITDAVAGLGALREKTTETGYRFELRRSMTETLNGSVGFSSSKRTGSDWTSLSSLDPANSNNALNTYLINTYCGGNACYGQALPAASILALSATTPFPMSMADVQRDKWRVTLDWTPFDRLNLQLRAEDGKDKNDTEPNPIDGGKGWRDSGVSFYSLDASFALSDTWKLTGYTSYGDQTIHINHSTGYMADLNNRSTALGLALSGQATSRLQVGANLTYVNDINKYGVAANTGTAGNTQTGFTVTQPSATNLAQAAVGLQDVTFRKTIVSVYGQYMIDKRSDIRLDVAYQKAKYNDWVWRSETAPFTYADNTMVYQQVNQSVTFVAVTYIYKFR